MRARCGKDSQLCRGLSLIELAIAMAIFGLMLATAIATYNAYKKNRLVSDTTGNIAKVVRAINLYYMKTGTYPCPARPNAAATASTYGMAFCPPASSPSPGSCVGTMCRATGAQLASRPVIIGVVPFATLDLNSTDAIDGWGRRLSYAVTQSQTVAATFLNGSGEIRIMKEDGTPLREKSPGVERYAHFVVISHGPDGRGAYSVEGRLLGACAATGRDRENCDNDSNFIWNDDTGATVRVLSDAATYYDDFVGEQYFLPPTLWRVAPNKTDFLTASSQNIGIGTTGPMQKLEVNGDVNTNNTLARRYCTRNMASSTDDCVMVENFVDPGNPGDNNIHCPNFAQGEGMTGIQKGKAVCNLSGPAGLNLACPNPGEFMTGIMGGVPVCAPPP